MANSTREPFRGLVAERRSASKRRIWIVMRHSFLNSQAFDISWRCCLITDLNGKKICQQSEKGNMFLFANKIMSNLTFITSISHSGLPPFIFQWKVSSGTRRLVGRRRSSSNVYLDYRRCRKGRHIEQVSNESSRSSVYTSCSSKTCSALTYTLCFLFHLVRRSSRWSSGLWIRGIKSIGNMKTSTSSP